MFMKKAIFGTRRNNARARRELHLEDDEIPRAILLLDRKIGKRSNYFKRGEGKRSLT